MTTQPYMMLCMDAEVFLKADEGVQGSRNVLASGGHEGLARGVARGGRSCSRSHHQELLSRVGKKAINQKVIVR
jgi:hypothetical protein